MQHFNLGSKEAQQWLAQWKEFLAHRERALVVGRKRIHETLKDDTATEKLLFMVRSFLYFWSSLSSRRSWPRMTACTLANAARRPRRLSSRLRPSASLHDTW